MTDAIFYVFFVYVIASFAALYVIVRNHEKERADLLNRIMAKDYNEYTFTGKQQPIGPAKNAYKDALDRVRIRNQQEDEG